MPTPAPDFFGYNPNNKLVVSEQYLYEVNSELGTLTKTKAVLEAEIIALKKQITEYNRAMTELVVERDSACASFSEALRQVAEAEKEVKKKSPRAIETLKMANAALELAQYARNLEGNEPIPGIYILKVEALARKMVE
jgi:chromosome segregation ATPase